MKEKKEKSKENPIVEDVIDDTAFFDTGIIGSPEEEIPYIPSEEELDEYCNTSQMDLDKDALKGNIKNLTKNLNLSEELKKGLGNKLMDFVDDAARFGFENYAIFFVVFAIVNSIKEAKLDSEEVLENAKEGMKDLESICEEASNDILSFKNSKKEREQELLKYENNPMKYNYESEKLDRLYKEEIISNADSRYNRLLDKAEEFANKFYKDDPVKAARLKRVLVSQGYSLINQKIIQKGYEVTHSGKKVSLNGKDLHVPKDSVLVSESNSTYNTRIKELEDKGLLNDNSLEEDEMELTKHNT